METSVKTVITVAVAIKAPISKVWEYWTKPEHITRWNAASDDWHTHFAENDLREGGRFTSRMEAKDGSFGFDFGGVYDKVTEHKLIEYTLGDGRKVVVNFSEDEAISHVTESFEAEQTHTLEMQQGGWQAILDNFRNYVEASERK